MTTEIIIEKLRLKIPAASSLRTARQGEALARAVADSLAKRLNDRSVSAKSSVIDHVRIALPQKQTNAAGVARAIDGALRRKISGSRRAR